MHARLCASEHMRLELVDVGTCEMPRRSRGRRGLYVHISVCTGPTFERRTSPCHSGTDRKAPSRCCARKWDDTETGSNGTDGPVY